MLPMIEIKIDKKSDKPLYIQIRDQLEFAIIEGELKPGDKLLSVASMAKKIGVTQTTVRRALEDLSKAGHTKCHVGRGTFIENAESLQEIQVNPETGLNTDIAGIQTNKYGYQARPELKRAAKRLRNGIKKGLKDLLNFSRQPDQIQFANGLPDHRSGFEATFQKIVEETIKENPVQYLEHGDCQGMFELRREIALRYSNNKIHITPEQVLITNGAQQGASIVAQDAFERKLNTICETPCFQGIPETFQAHGNWVDSVQRDHKGPDPEQLDQFAQNSPGLLYICPEMHNPMGKDIAPKRMKKVAKWAKKTKSIVLSDEIYHDLRLEGTAPDSVIKAVGENQGIVISSMSKAYFSGLRVGWLISSSARIQEYTNYKRLMDQACPTLMQGIALNMFRSGKYDSHIKQIRQTYLERKDVMIKCLEQMMPADVTFTKPNGGFSLWLTLPEGYSSIALLLSAMDRGVNFLPGPVFDIDQRYVNSLRLTYTWTDIDQIKEGIEILADTIKELLRKPPGDSGLSGIGSFQ
jgi:DNA-binding transcriptional MocR family regulator